jgi:aryl-alcohol dehydrogenase-like predicted oxidoreductase
MYYSLVGRDLEYEIIPFCEDAGIGIVVWSPLASGFLTGRYTREDPAGGKGRLASAEFLPTDKEKGFVLIDKMKQIASGQRASVAQVALAWLLAKPFVSSILLGASKMSQLDDNLGALQVKLSSTDIADLEKLTEPPALYPQWFQKNLIDAPLNEALSPKASE